MAKDENAIENDRREIFCHEYLIDFNATKAAIRAGYSEKTARTQGSFLLTNVDILTRIGDLVTERKERLKVDAGFVLEGLIEVYNRCMEKTPVMVWDIDKKCYVQEVEINEDGTTTNVWKFDAMGALKALETIGRHLKMFTDKKEIEMPGAKKIIVEYANGQNTSN